jgi:hypothetical protein
MRRTGFAAVSMLWIAIGFSCAPAPPKSRPAAEVQKPSTDAAAIKMESAAGPEHNVFMQDQKPVVRLKLQNVSAREVGVPIECVVTDFPGKEVHRSSQTVNLSPQSTKEVEWPLPLAGFGYFEAAFSVYDKKVTVPLVVLKSKPDVKVAPGGLAGWAPSGGGTGGPAQTSELTRKYLEGLSGLPPRPVHWEDSKTAGAVVPSPEMAAQRTISTLLEGATFRRKIEAGPLRAYRFYKKDAKGPIWAVWTTAPCGPVALRPLETPVVVTDLMGNSLGLKPRHDTILIVPCEMPIFVTLPTMEIMTVTPLVSVVEPPQKVRAGEPAQVTVEIWNPLKDSMKATVSLSLPKGWTDFTKETTMNVEEGAKGRVTMKFTPAAESGPGRETVKVSINFGLPELPPAELPVPVEVQERKGK